MQHMVSYAISVFRNCETDMKLLIRTILIVGNVYGILYWHKFLKSFVHIFRDNVCL